MKLMRVEIISIEYNIASTSFMVMEYKIERFYVELPYMYFIDLLSGIYKEFGVDRLTILSISYYMFPWVLDRY